MQMGVAARLVPGAISKFHRTRLRPEAVNGYLFGMAYATSLIGMYVGCLVLAERDARRRWPS